MGKDWRIRSLVDRANEKEWHYLVEVLPYGNYNVNEEYFYDGASKSGSLSKLKEYDRDNVENLLNMYGKEGWELCSTEPSGDKESIIFIFKREKKKEPLVRRRKKIIKNDME